MTTTWIGSPNYSSGRGGNAIDRIVIHWMVGTLASTDAVFQNTTRRTSAHYGIEDGNIHQYVTEENTAFHAGTGQMNQRSIGIEHSAAPGRNATQATIDTSAQLVADICKRRNIPCDRSHIIKHSEVIATQCCGTIPIDEIVSKANAILKGEDMPTKVTLESGRKLLFDQGYNGLFDKKNALKGDCDDLIKQYFTGRDLEEVLWSTYNDPMAVKYREDYQPKADAALKAGTTTPVTLAPGIYKV